ALAAAAVAAESMVALLVPARLPPEPPLRGYRATQREAALAELPWLRAAWPMVRLCTWYGHFLPLASWRRARAAQLRNAGEPWGLSPDEFLGLLIAATIGGGGAGVIFSWASGTGWGTALLGAFLGLFLP